MTKKKESKKSEEKVLKSNQSNQQSAEDFTQIQKENDDLKQEISELKDKNLRQLAEMDNIRKNAAKQRQDYMKYKYNGIAGDLLEVLDNFDRCLKNIEDDSVKEGISLIKNQLLSVFAKNGIKPMEIKEGDEFNTDYHEAVSVIDAGEEMKNKVVAVTDTGYTYSDKVLRYAKVIVGQ
jgi:molecular chaperone GrpE